MAKGMNSRIRIVLAVVVLAVCSFLVWKPGITGKAVEEIPYKVAVVVREDVKPAGITGAVAAGSVGGKEKPQDVVIRDVNKPSWLSFRDSSGDVEVVRMMDRVPVMIVETTGDGLEELQRHQLVEAVYPNMQFELALADSVPLVNADDAWPEVVSGENVVGTNVSVCVVDTGIDAAHPAFQGRVVNEKCYCAGCCPNGQDEDNNATDTHSVSHGTHVSGIVAANGTVKGVAPAANIVAVKVCSSSCGLFDIFSGLDYCLQVKDQFNVVAISGSIGDGGNYQAQSDCPTFFDSAVDAAYQEGITSVFAAGNNGYTNGISYPGCSPNAIAVGATDKNDAIASFSNRGSLMEVLAPGVSITSTKAGGQYGGLSGTSQATPHVSGAVALMQQYARLAGVNVTPDDVRDALMQTGKDVGGFPRIDVRAALESVGLVNQTNQTNQTGQAPVVAIASPVNGSIVESPVTFVGNATDYLNGTVDGQNLSWVESGSVVAVGSAVQVNVTSGSHTVTLRAVDAYNNSGVANVSFVVPTCLTDIELTNDSVLNGSDVAALLEGVFAGTNQCSNLTVNASCLADLDQNVDGVLRIGDFVLLLTDVLQNSTENVFGEKC